MHRYSVLVIVDRAPLDDAILESSDYLAEYLADRFLDPDSVHPELYATGDAARIQRKLHVPRALETDQKELSAQSALAPNPAETELGPIHAIWDGRTWLTPGTCPSAPPEDNGATDWQWAHYNALMNAAPDSLMFLWDVHVEEETEQLAA